MNVVVERIKKYAGELETLKDTKSSLIEALNVTDKRIVEVRAIIEELSTIVSIQESRGLTVISENQGTTGISIGKATLSQG